MSDTDIVKECRICFEEETDSNPFIQPCKCSGTSKYIHLSCLEKWRSQCENPEARKKCMECGTKYLISKKYPLEINPFEKNVVLSPRFAKGYCNYLLMTVFNSTLLYWIDFDTQASMIVFSFGNNWYNKTITTVLKTNAVELSFIYYYSLTLQIQNIFLMIYWFYLINKKIYRKKRFYKFIVSELVLLNILAYNWFYIFYGCSILGNSWEAFQIILMMFFFGGLLNSFYPVSMAIITKNSINNLNNNENPETVLTAISNPLYNRQEINDIGIEIGEAKYDELATESDESD